MNARNEIKQRLLVHEAERWVGIKEVGGDNRGQAVEMFQRAVDGKAAGEAWCLAFVQFCIRQTDDTFDCFMNMCMPRTCLPATEHCLTLWRSAPVAQRVGPEPGAVVLWQHGDTTSGHAGIVTAVMGDGTLATIEGNTGVGAAGTGGGGQNQVVREGDGVYTRKRHAAGTAEMKVLGFLRPWAE